MDFSISLQELLDQYKTLEKSVTENGAIAYKTSGKKLLDFNFSITSMRSWDWGRIEAEFAPVFYENPLIAVKYWFYCMDCREGLGERNISKGIMSWMVKNHPEIVEKVFKYIPDYNRWDTFIMLADPQFNDNEELRFKALKIIESQFAKDLANLSVNKSVSLLAKWMPSENASSKNTRRLARQIMKDLNIRPRYYRKGLSLLRNKLRVVERNMSANEWSKIDYEAIPSKANLNYSNAFMRHDTERRQEYLNSLAKGEIKINSKVLAPYEIVKKYSIDSYRIKPYDEALEQMWKALPQYQLNDILVVRDGSGSMTDRCTGNTTCLDVATSIAIYAAEHNSKNWYNKFITFSSKPEFVNMGGNCSSLREKIALCNTYNDCSNTDIYKTMKLILTTAINNHYKQYQLPKSILIISDMQFDAHEIGYYNSYHTYEHGSFNYDKTLFEKIQREYSTFGYKLPKIIFWNVDSRGNKTIPIQNNDLGMTLVSGFSANIFKMVLGEELNPYKQLLSILNSERYEPVEKALRA